MIRGEGAKVVKIHEAEDGEQDAGERDRKLQRVSLSLGEYSSSQV